jgi:hypothetical protein
LGFGINFEKNQEKLILEKRKKTSPKPPEEVSDQGKPAENNSNVEDERKPLEDERKPIEEAQEKRLITCKFFCFDIWNMKIYFFFSNKFSEKHQKLILRAKISDSK